MPRIPDPAPMPAGTRTLADFLHWLGDHLVRIPSVAFCAAGTFRGDIPPGEAAAGIVPQFVAEVTDGILPTELERRIEDYFANGVKLVWAIDVGGRTATTYTSAKKF